jgi:endonuclease V-like protein UPF0215 family
MRSYNIRQVKKEIRVLGLAVRKAVETEGFHVVGVVFRGRLWLDGVMRTKAGGADVTREAVEMITGSPHHPQIRVILLDRGLIDSSATLDPCGLSSGASRPVIAMGFGEALCPEEDGSVHRFDFEGGGARVPVLSVGLSSRVALRVLENASRGDAVPEALRVSGLVISAFSGSSQHNL